MTSSAKTQEKKFAGYEIVRPVGSGGYFDIFLTEKEGAEFALKRIKRHFMYDRGVVSSIQKEGQVLEAVQNSPHFPRFFEQGVENEFHFLVLEYIDGVNLEQASERSRAKNLPLSPLLGAQILLEICQGLRELHQLEITSGQSAIHGDLKPRNVMVSTGGKTKIIDLGLTGGTFNYMPLERLHDKAVTAFSDIFALGQTAYELFHEDRLFKGKTTLAAYFEMREIKITEDTFNSKLPLGLRRILARCLDQESPERFQNIEEMGVELESFLSGENFGFQPEKLGQWIRSLKG